MAASGQELIKIIETKQTFADLAYKEFRASRFGMTFCCPVNFNDHTIVNEICDWESNRRKITYSSETYTFTSWNHKRWIENGNNPPETWVRRLAPTAEPQSHADHGWLSRNTPFSASNHNVNFRSTWRSGATTDARSTPDGQDMTGTIPASEIDHMVAFWKWGSDPDYPFVRGVSRIYLLTMQHCDVVGYDTDYSLNSDKCYVQTMIREGQELPENSDMGAHFHILKVTDWIFLNPETNLTPGSGDFVTKLRANTNATAPGLKNGGNRFDQLWMLVDYMGDFSKVDFVYSTTNKAFVYANMTNASFNPGSSADMKFDDMSKVYKITLIGSEQTSTAKASRASTKFWNTGFVPNLPEEVKAYPSEGWQCKTDDEGLIIEVKDSLGNLVKDYPIIIDNTYVGDTDASGLFYYTIKNASEDTKHIVNCECFTTTGACNQQYIQIVTTTDPLKATCTQQAIDCL